MHERDRADLARTQVRLLAVTRAWSGGYEPARIGLRAEVEGWDLANLHKAEPGRSQRNELVVTLSYLDPDVETLTGNREEHFNLCDLLILARLAPALADSSADLAPAVLPGPRRARAMSRTADPDTSKRAAAIARGDVSDLQRKVLRHLAGHPAGLCDFDLQEHIGDQGTSTFRTRRAELRDAGLVEPSGVLIERRGRQRIVWRLTRRGFQLAASLE